MSAVRSQRKDGVLIVTLTVEKILDDALIIQIGRELFRLADQAGGKMLLDFQGVTFMTSSMIGKVVVLSKKCKSIDTEFRMCNVPATVIDVLDKRRLNSVFKIFDSQEEALSDLARCTDPPNE
jgi:anti-sigma B factor antagonist